MEMFKEQTHEAKQRLLKKLEHDKMNSLKDYNYAQEKQFYATSRMGGSVRVGGSPDDKSQQSKTQVSGFWGGNRNH